MESQYDVRIVGCSGGIGGKRCLLAKFLYMKLKLSRALCRLLEVEKS